MEGSEVRHVAFGVLASRFTGFIFVDFQHHVDRHTFCLEQAENHQPKYWLSIFFLKWSIINLLQMSHEKKNGFTFHEILVVY